MSGALQIIFKQQSCYNINVAYHEGVYLYMKNILTEENINKLKEELD